ncbi:MAG: hypothetical protein ONB44_00385 [candidate division KSB1 bacterium]|nr:hypothetical protein [candidate division KSB1 bacterium]MDZ7300578.1 hypothetical protein [candidate division KSB1 bacterium]MDZ7309715.1 hypothetical protein [candidate division KSB1 bacterium]
MATAFLNPDGEIAVVVMNQTEKNIEFHSWTENRAVKTNSPEHSLITLVL